MEIINVGKQRAGKMSKQQINLLFRAGHVAVGDGNFLCNLQRRFLKQDYSNSNNLIL